MSSSLSPEQQTDLAELARQIRINSLKAIHQAKSGHPGGSCSAAEILAVLYGAVLKHRPTEPGWAERDRLVISKGHASPAIYSVLALQGYYPLAEFLSGFRQLGSPYQGHIDASKVAGVEFSTGSLGHGLSAANGMALGLRLDRSPVQVYALLSDGELQEGQTWEAAMAAAHYQLGNLTAIVDRNRIQLDGFTEQTMALEPLADKFKAFGWAVTELAGHDLNALYSALQSARERPASAPPTLILANTIKGQGISFMADQVKWHGSAPNDEQLSAALTELSAS